MSTYNINMNTIEKEKIISDYHYQRLQKMEQEIFDEAWDDITNSKEFIDAVNNRIKEIIKEKKL